MAGSYNHIVNDSGDLRSPKGIANMLDVHPSMAKDVAECVEEMYGMIWLLASMGQPYPKMVDEETMISRVELARQNYKEGLALAKRLRNKRVE